MSAWLQRRLWVLPEVPRCAHSAQPGSGSGKGRSWPGGCHVWCAGCPCGGAGEQLILQHLHAGAASVCWLLREGELLVIRSRRAPSPAIRGGKRARHHGPCLLCAEALVGVTAGLAEESRGLGAVAPVQGEQGHVCIGAHGWSVLLLRPSPVPSTGAGGGLQCVRPPTVFWSSRHWSVRPTVSL